MTSKWSEGIVPQRFRWVIADRLAVCDRPGGYGPGHRRVRREEEIIWLSRSDINMIVTLTSAPYNLSDYKKHQIACVHLPFNGPQDGPAALELVFKTIQDRVAKHCVLLHRDSIGDRLTGIVAGYFIWTGLVPIGTDAITITERLLEREMGPIAREIVNMTLQLPQLQNR